jgi:hypothetical protein
LILQINFKNILFINKNILKNNFIIVTNTFEYIYIYI